MRRRILLSATAAMLAAACAPLAPPHSTVIRGKFSAVSRGLGNESLSGRYRLTRSADITELELLSPLGGTLARVTIDAAGALLESSGVEKRAPSASELLLDTTGFEIPAEALYSWLNGVPAAGTGSRKTEEGFIQTGWKVKVKRRNAAGEPVLLSACRPATGKTPEIVITLTAEREERK